MALSVTDRGTATRTGGGTTWAVSPTSTIAARSFGFLFLAYDNSGTNGANPISAANLTDSVGNIWDRFDFDVQDPGAANAGVAVTTYLCRTLTTAMTSSDSVTVDFGGFTTASAVAIWSQIDASEGNVLTVAGNSVRGVTPTNTITHTASITIDNVVIGCLAHESNGTVTGDADTTNGNWSTQQTAVANTGTSATSIRASTQWKVVTATGNQTFNPTVSVNSDWVVLLERFTEVVPRNRVIVQDQAVHRASRW